VAASVYDRSVTKLYFFELHEGATDLMTDALLVSERDHTPPQFAQLVETARSAILETYEEDTLVEAIARELERAHGFTYIGDEKLRASMSVGVEEADTFLVEQSDEFRSIVAELESP
jgi:peptide subunit release factor 1 (eRF1)